MATSRPRWLPSSGRCAISTRPTHTCLHACGRVRGRPISQNPKPTLQLQLQLQLQTQPQFALPHRHNNLKVLHVLCSTRHQVKHLRRLWLLLLLPDHVSLPPVLLLPDPATMPSRTLEAYLLHQEVLILIGLLARRQLSLKLQQGG